MKYTSLQVEAANRHLEAVSSAKQLLVVGGVATSYAMAMDYARAECEVARQQNLNPNMEADALTLPEALENPNQLLSRSETYIKGLSAGAMAVCSALQNAGECEQPLAVTAQGAPTGNNDFEELVKASLLGMHEVPLRYRIGGIRLLQHGPLYWKAGQEAAKFSVLEHAIMARSSGKHFDQVDFDNDRFFRHTSKQLAMAAARGVNIYLLSGVHNEHFINGKKVTRDYLREVTRRANHRDAKKTVSV